jgi:hypothetical protein
LTATLPIIHYFTPTIHLSLSNTISDEVAVVNLFNLLALIKNRTMIMVILPCLLIDRYKLERTLEKPRLMKTLHQFLKFTLPIICMFAFAPSANAQFLKKLGKRAEKAAERVVERRVEQEAEKKTDAALDSILEPGQKKKKRKPRSNKKESENTSSDEIELNENESTETNNEEVSAEDLKPWSNYNFVPGDKIIFQDDLAGE